MNGSEMGLGEQVLGWRWLFWHVVEFRVHMKPTGKMSPISGEDTHLEHGEQ